MSNIKEEAFQAAVTLLTDRKAVALAISNRDSLLALTVYSEERKNAHRDYAEALNNKELSWAEARKKLSAALIDARKNREGREDNVFLKYINALDEAELAFDKEAHALDKFDAPMP